MPHDPTNFRRRLFESQEITPSLRAAYDKDLDAILHEAPGLKQRFLAIVLLVIMLAIVAGEVRILLIHPGDVTFYIAAVTMLIACAVTSVWLVRDLRRAKVAKKSAHQVSELFYAVAAILTVASLMHGLGAADNPKSTFDAFFIFVFLFVCSVWGLSNRIAATEMAIKEQMLRLECRLADMAERLNASQTNGSGAAPDH
jgi:hypothetical protein